MLGIISIIVMSLNDGQLIWQGFAMLVICFLIAAGSQILADRSDDEA